MEKSAVTATCNLGNTDKIASKQKTGKRIRSSESKRYCFTLNNWKLDELNKLIKTAETASIKYIIGEEVGESGTPHLQGYINMPIKKSMSAVIKLFNIPAIHWEQTKGSEEQNCVYCSKDNKYHSNFYTAPEQLEIIDKLDNWMVELEKLLTTKADKRAVYWIWEPIGGVGKSSFCKYLCHKYNATYIDEGKKSDLINIIYNIKNVGSQSIIAIDVPRNNGNKVSYKAIEQIKNGMICNTKYETGMKLFNSPHLIIFSNFEPDIGELSTDRWRIGEIKKKSISWSSAEQSSLPK